MRDLAEQSASEIMEAFARRTGLSPDGSQRRYLWTDAFALCTYLTLFRRSRDPRFAEQAIRLIDRVHHVLGRYRPGDARSGWISGLRDPEGERHPTIGGLRIGKPLDERRPEEDFDAQLEWERDGQYFHYLLRWMHALGRAAVVLENADFHQWALELGAAAHRGFTYAAFSGGPRRIHWKMSTDLSRPLVPSQGAHDPLDGLVTFCTLRVGAGGPSGSEGMPLTGEVLELSAMCRSEDWATADPLGVGGLLCDVWWTVQLLASGSPDRALLEPMLEPLIDATLVSLRALSHSQVFALPPEHRLAFRELGFAIGLSAASSSVEAAPGLPGGLRSLGIDELERYLPLGDRIRSTWLAPSSRATPAWKAHEDINDVMLATALAPEEHLRT